MQVIETMLGRLGSRLTLHFLPREHLIRLSPLGKFYDRAWSLRLGVRLTNPDGANSKLYLLPLGELAGDDETYFQEVEQKLASTEVTFRGRQREVGLEVKFKFIAPFYPQNEKLCTAPFFYLDIQLLKGPRNRKIELVAELQGEGIEIADFASDTILGATLHSDYQMQPDHWGGQPTDRLSLKTFRAPLLFGLVQPPQEATLEQDKGVQIKCELGTTTARLILATYTNAPILDVRGTPYRFKYTEFFQSVQEVVKYAIDEESFIRQRCELFDTLFRDNSLGKSGRDLLSFAFQSYLPNTWWAVSLANPHDDWFSVWEGNCVFHSTVDVEYNLAWIYLMLWPQLLEKTLAQWRHYVQTTPEGAVMSHDIGGLLGANKQQYPHSMEVEENANFILLTYALWRYSGREAVLQDNLETITRLVRYILDSDTTGNGFPNRGVANTIDDASPAVQFGREQVYLAVKALAACWAVRLMLRSHPDHEMQILAAECQTRVELINYTLNTEGWLDDHYAVTLDRRTDGLVNPWDGQPLPPGPLLGWDAYSLYTANGLLYLLATDPDAKNLPPANYERLKSDLQTSVAHSLTEYGCTHTSYDQSNLWVSQNLWRDIIAGQLGLDVGQMLDRYWAFQQYENSQGRGGCFVDTYGSNWLHYYPRGITAIGLWYGLSGLKLDRQAGQISFAPVQLPLRVPLPTFADWENGLIPWVNFKLDCNLVNTEFENQHLLDGLEIITS